MFNVEGIDLTKMNLGKLHQKRSFMEELLYCVYSVSQRGVIHFEFSTVVRYPVKLQCAQKIFQKTQHTRLNAARITQEKVFDFGMSLQLCPPYLPYQVMSIFFLRYKML